MMHGRKNIKLKNKLNEMTEGTFCNKFLKAVQRYVKFTHCSCSISKL